MWSESLIEITVKSLTDIKNSSLKDLPIIAMKQFDGKFGIMITRDLHNNKFIIYDREDHNMIMFDNVSELVTNGWVID